MDEILNYPKFDPHGEPIPDKDGNIFSQNLKKLSSCSVNDKVIFKAVTYSDDEFLNYLNERKLTLGKTLEILKIESFDQSVKIKSGSRQDILSKLAADKILVLTQ